MEMVFATPQLDGHDEAVVAEINAIRAELSRLVRVPRRWQGTLRRAAQARAIRGSNSIEGYVVSQADAAAAVDDEAPQNADERTWAEIVGYRRVLTYVLNVASQPNFVLDESVICSMHFMLLEHDLGKAPGRYRSGPVYVANEATGRIDYTAPEASRVPDLLQAAVAQVRDSTATVLVKAALAHLNLVMIHPFRDGNGRMARAIQTLVLAQDQVLEPAFSSIEEWLGANTADYYAVLAATGGGSWQPERSARLWVQFCLRAHHIQAQTVRRRFAEADHLWVAIDEIVAHQNLPKRAEGALFDALQGWRVTRPSYRARAEVDTRTATRDLARLADLGLLDPHGQTKGRFYLAGPELLNLGSEVRSARTTVSDPYPDLIRVIHEQAQLAEQQTCSSSEQLV